MTRVKDYLLQSSYSMHKKLELKMSATELGNLEKNHN